MVDELDRFRDDIAPLRLSVLMVRDFNGQMGDSWLETFPTYKMWDEVTPCIAEMILNAADGLAFARADHQDRVLCRELLSPLADFTYAEDDAWLISRYNTHLMCADVATALAIIDRLKDKRNVHIVDVHIIQTAHVNPDLKDRPRGVGLPGKLRQGTLATWLIPEQELGITMTHYFYE
jgi:hypothetical protein